MSENKTDFWIDFFVGISDGLVIPFVAMAVLNLFFPAFTVAIIAFAIVVFYAAAMGLSRYFATKPLLYKDVHETVSAFGLEQKTQDFIAGEISKTDEEWSALVRQIDDTDAPAKSAWIVSLSYWIAGVLPIIPFFVFTDSVLCFRVSAIIFIVSLFISGFFKGKFTGRPPWMTALRTTFTGCITAGICYGAALLFT